MKKLQSLITLLIVFHSTFFMYKSSNCSFLNKVNTIPKSLETKNSSHAAKSSFSNTVQKVNEHAPNVIIIHGDLTFDDTERIKEANIYYEVLKDKNSSKELIDEALEFFELTPDYSMQDLEEKYKKIINRATRHLQAYNKTTPKTAEKDFKINDKKNNALSVLKLNDLAYNLDNRDKPLDVAQKIHSNFERLSASSQDAAQFKKLNEAYKFLSTMYPVDQYLLSKATPSSLSSQEFSSEKKVSFDSSAKDINKNTKLRKIKNAITNSDIALNIFDLSEDYSQDDLDDEYAKYLDQNEMFYKLTKEKTCKQDVRAFALRFFELANECSAEDIERKYKKNEINAHEAYDFLTKKLEKDKKISEALSTLRIDQSFYKTKNNLELSMLIQSQFENLSKTDNSVAVNNFLDIYEAYQFLKTIYQVNQYLLSEAYKLLRLDEASASKEDVLKAKENILRFLQKDLQKEYLDACQVILKDIEKKENKLLKENKLKENKALKSSAANAPKLKPKESDDDW